jgi:hypothetical protein
MQLQCSRPTAPSQERCVQLKMSSVTNKCSRNCKAQHNQIKGQLTKNAMPSTSRFLIAMQHSPRPCWKKQTYTYIVTASYCHCVTEHRATVLRSLFMHIWGAPTRAQDLKSSPKTQQSRGGHLSDIVFHN